MTCPPSRTTWSKSPLKINTLDFAFDRFKSGYKTAPFNLNTAIPNHNCVFPEQEHKAILQGMERKPSEIETAESKRAQTWAYNKKANQMVDHATYKEGGAKAGPEEQAAFRTQFDSTRELMIKAFLDKWFPKDDSKVSVDGVEVEFGTWCRESQARSCFPPKKKGVVRCPSVLPHASSHGARCGGSVEGRGG